MSTVYYHCVVSRSDGCRETATGRDGAREPNQPTKAQIDDTPKPINDPKEAANGKSQNKMVVDCYKKLDSSEVKAVEWRRKLGGMLMSILTKDQKDLRRKMTLIIRFPFVPDT